MNAVRIAVALARYRVAAHALAALANFAEDHGVDAVLAWVEEDPGWAFCPSSPFGIFRGGSALVTQRG
jgi:hypothetical protein